MELQKRQKITLTLGEDVIMRLRLLSAVCGQTNSEIANYAISEYLVKAFKEKADLFVEKMKSLDSDLLKDSQA